MKLKDIAVMANVSPSTVSLVLKGRKGVSDEKRELILKLLRENGYSVEQEAAEASPQHVKKRNICFVKYKRHGMLVDGNPGFINTIVDAIGIECRRQGYTLQMTSCSQEQLPEFFEIIEDTMADGILFLGTELTKEDTRYLSAVTIPMIILDTSFESMEYNYVLMNNREAIFALVDHLASMGHTEIGFIANENPSNNCMNRERAFCDAVVQKGIHFDPSLIYYVHPTTDGAYRSIRRMLENNIRFPSALIANNDCFALGAIKAFKEFGITIPGDISITGFDGIPFSSISDPPLTTMEVPCVEIGIWAVRILSDRIRYPFSATAKLELSTKLMIRGSTAACPQ